MTTKTNTSDRIDEMYLLEGILEGRGLKIKGIPATTEDIFHEATEFYETYVPKNY